MDLASKMISRGKVEQVYSLGEPIYVPIVYIYCHEIFDCSFVHFSYEKCPKVLTVSSRI